MSTADTTAPAAPLPSPAAALLAAPGRASPKR